MISAPPMPMKARVAMSWVAVSEIAAAAEPMANRTRPSCSAPLRPNRSERLPVVSNSPANTRTYESMIHWISEFEASKSVISDGIATFRIVLSITMIRRLRQSTARISQRRSFGASSASSCRAGGVSSVVMNRGLSDLSSTDATALFDTERFRIVNGSPSMEKARSRDIGHRRSAPKAEDQLG